MKWSAGIVAVLLLAGCGGGGSSDSGNSGSEERRLMPLSQATASIASASMDFSQYPTELGILAVSGVNILGSRNHQTLPCDNEDSVNNKPSVSFDAQRLYPNVWNDGDQIRISFQNGCKLKGISSPFDGVITVALNMQRQDVTNLSSFKFSLLLDGLTQTYTDVNGNSTTALPLDGEIEGDWSYIPGGKSMLHITNKNDSSISFANYFFLHDLNYSGQWDEGTAQYSVSTEAKVSESIDGDYFLVKTRTPLQGRIGSSPSSGDIRVQGANDKYVSITPDNSNPEWVRIVGKGTDFDHDAGGTWSNYLSGAFWSSVGSIDIFERINYSQIRDVVPIWSSLKVNDEDPAINMEVNIDTSTDHYQTFYTINDAGLNPLVSALFLKKGDISALFYTNIPNNYGRYEIPADVSWIGQRAQIKPRTSLTPGSQYFLVIKNHDDSAGYSETRLIIFNTSGSVGTVGNSIIDAGDDQFFNVGSIGNLHGTALPFMGGFNWNVRDVSNNTEDEVATVTFSDDSSLNSSFTTAGTESDGLKNLFVLTTTDYPVASFAVVNFIRSNKDKSYFAIDSIKGIKNPITHKMMIGDLSAPVYEGISGVSFGSDYWEHFRSVHLVATGLPDSTTENTETYISSAGSEIIFSWERPIQYDVSYYPEYLDSYVYEETIKWSELCAKSKLDVKYLSPKPAPMQKDNLAINFILTCLDVGKDIEIKGRVRQGSEID
jgi:hypothetical protein